MSGTIVVDTTGMTDLARVARQAARTVGIHADALRHKGRDGGRATQQAKLEAGYETAYGRALHLLDALAGSIDAFGGAVEHIAEGYVRADAAGSGTERGSIGGIGAR